MRKGEIMGMRWQDLHISQEQNFTRIHPTKTNNNQSRSVLLTSHALELLEDRRTKLLENTKLKVATGLIFPGPITTDKPADLRKALGCGNGESRPQRLSLSRPATHDSQLPSDG
jgi:integrase